MVTRHAPIPTGWAVLAGSVLFVAGLINVILGVVTLVNPIASTVAAQGQIVWGLATWGWIYVILGVVQGVLSFGLFVVQRPQRPAIVASGLSSRSQSASAEVCQRPPSATDTASSSPGQGGDV